MNKPTICKARIVNPGWTADYGVKTGDVVTATHFGHQLWDFYHKNAHGELTGDTSRRSGSLPHLRLIAGTFNKCTV